MLLPLPQEPLGVMDAVLSVSLLDKRLKSGTSLLRPVPRASQSNCPGCFLWVLLLLLVGACVCVWGGYFVILLVVMST